MSIFLVEGELWESNKIREIFSTQNKLHNMAKMEIALAQAQAELGLIEKSAAKIIESKKDVKFDEEFYVAKVLETGGHPVTPFLDTWKKHFVTDAEKEAAKHIHYGATTQDVLDTALVLQFKEVYDIVIEELEQIKIVLAHLSNEHKNTPMAGRTHSQHAVPITFGYKTAIWLCETQRQIDRLKESAERMFVASFYGATGNVNSLEKDGMKVCELMAKKLGLNYFPLPWHTCRDTMAEFLSDLVNITCTFGKIGNELYELGRSELLEVQEYWQKGHIGSSTMPQKRNAFGMEVMTTIGRLSSYQIGAMYQDMMQQHERDFRTQDGEGFTCVTICHMCEHELAYAVRVLATLDVRPDDMKKNLDITNGAIMCESIMMTLSKHGMDRFEAHHKITPIAVKAFEQKMNVMDLCLQDPEIVKLVGEDNIRAAFVPENYVGVAPEMVERALDDCFKGVKISDIDKKYENIVTEIKKDPYFRK